MVTSNSTNLFGVSSFIVDASSSQGSFTTVQAAINAASSGKTVFIRPGTYTENLALKTGVNLVAFDADALTPSVTIIGKCTYSSSGTVSLSGIRLQTNADFFLEVTGVLASVVNLSNCYLNCTNNTGISFTTANAAALIDITNSQGDITAVGNAYFASSSTGMLRIYFSRFLNSGSSVTASTISAGSFVTAHCEFDAPLTTSGTSSFSAGHWSCANLGTNTTCLIIGGSGSQAVDRAYLHSGTASAISVGSSLSLSQSTVGSSNANAITGAGTLDVGIVTFISSSSTINTAVVNNLTTKGGTIV